MRPPILKTKGVAEFLFDTQQGFCEHIAASFAYLLRASGVPARVVVGFHGGVKNNFGKHYTVKEKDAHAWVELWNSGAKSWLRVDPTEVVAPLRIQLGGEMYHSLSQEELDAGLGHEDYLKNYKSSWYFKVVGQSQLVFDLTSMKWNQFLLNFDKQGQKDFFRNLGLKKIKFRHLGLLTVLALGVFFLWLNRFRYFKKVKLPKEVSIYYKLCAQLEASGVKKEIFHGPKNYFKLCQNKYPNSSRLFDNFLNIYEPVIYGAQDASEKDIEELGSISQKIIKEVVKTA